MVKAELITQASDEDREIYIVRYQRELWVFIYHSDPALDFVVNPAGHSCCDIWDPFGAYSHPLVPEDIWVAVEELITANA
jgi:hypothetical protein